MTAIAIIFLALVLLWTMPDFEEMMEVADVHLVEAIVTAIKAERQALYVAMNALELIAAPKRSDGTYNRCRVACEQLALQTLHTLKAIRSTPTKE
jgi:hypothetical protein